MVEPMMNRREGDKTRILVDQGDRHLGMARHFGAVVVYLGWLETLEGMQYWAGKLVVCILAVSFVLPAAEIRIAGGRLAMKDSRVEYFVVGTAQNVAGLSVAPLAGGILPELDIGMLLLA